MWYTIALALAVSVVICVLTGCADSRPTCYDNPRNMSCMSPEQLERELNK